MISEEDKEKAALEKRKHIRITPMCNNNCRFCLAGEIKKEGHYSKEKIIDEMKQGIKEGNSRLILSGGEPSIHPLFIEIIKAGKKFGYKKVQTISNGRMFCNKKFILKCKTAGLDEITFSIHGHTSTLHDYLTRVPGSFEQIKQGIKNALKLQLIVSCDVVLTKPNYKNFPDIIRFIYSLGVMEIDVLHIVPFGNAYINKEEIFYDLDDAVKYIHQGLKFAKDHDIVIWTNRLPAQYLEGFEDLIQDSTKFLDEIEGRKEHFERVLAKNEKPDCFGNRCQYCHMLSLCSELFDRKETYCKTKKMNPLRNNSSIKNEKDVIFQFMPPGKSLIKYKKSAFKLSNVVPFLINDAKEKNIKVYFTNVPACICGKNHIYTAQKTRITNLKEFAEDFVKRNKIKRLSCKKCELNDECDGIYQKYVQVFGFEELIPQ